VLLAFMGFASCQNTVKSKFEIVNKSNQPIDSLSIEPNVSKVGKYVSVNSGETKVYLTDMSNIPKIDGSYTLTFKKGAIQRIKRFGYYTNGYPSEKLTIINIEPDTIKFNFIISK
jgi:hypothetical protein